MFNKLRAAIRLIATTRLVLRQEISINQETGGVETIEGVTSFNIEANIQNAGSDDHNSGQLITLDREQANIAHTVLILSNTEIGIGDPVYDNGKYTRYLIQYLGVWYRIMLAATIQARHVEGINIGGYYRYLGQLVTFPVPVDIPDPPDPLTGLIETEPRDGFLLLEDGSGYISLEGGLQ